MEGYCKLLDGKVLAKSIKETIKETLQEQIKYNPSLRLPKLVIYTDGLDEASKVYLRNKKNACEEVGISCDIINIGSNNRFDFNNEADGAILQLPVKNKKQEDYFLNVVSKMQDVDGLTLSNQGDLYNGYKDYFEYSDPDEYYHQPCTPKGIMCLLHRNDINVEGKNVLIIGRSNLVGKPLAMLMLQRNATVTIAHSKTHCRDLSFKLSEADIVVSAVGKANFIQPNELKKGCILVDVGINRDPFTGKLCGDVANPNNELDTICSYRTPVPGGVGPMTVAMLLENTYNAWLIKNNLL